MHPDIISRLESQMFPDHRVCPSSKRNVALQIITCSRDLLRMSLKDALCADAGAFEQVWLLCQACSCSEETKDVTTCHLPAQL